MWVSDPASAPVAAPTANPSSGTKKMRPKRKPQNAPPRAPAPVRLFRCRVLGFFLPSGQVTMAASWTLISLLRLQPLERAERVLGPVGGVELPDREGRHAFLLSGLPCRLAAAGWSTGSSGDQRHPETSGLSSPWSRV